MARSDDVQTVPSSPILSARERADRFCQRFGLEVPILQAPMAGACPVSLASAVANAGGMGGFGALTTTPDGIADWVREFRDQSNGGFQINLEIPTRVRFAIPTKACGARIPGTMGSGGAAASRRCRAARLCGPM